VTNALAAKVPTSRTLAGLDLTANRTAAEIVTALASALNTTYARAVSLPDPSGGDDTTAVQAVLTAAPSGTIITGNGKTYYVTKLTALQADIMFSRMKFVSRGGNTGPMSVLTVGADNDTTQRRVRFDRVTIDGNRAAHTGIETTVDKHRHGFNLVGRFSQIVMDECEATYCATDGLHLFGGFGIDAVRLYNLGVKTGVRLNNCRFNYNRRQGSTVDSTSDYVATGCEFNFNGTNIGASEGEQGELLSGVLYGAGVWVEEYNLKNYTADLHFTSCKFLGNARRGFNAYSGAVDPRDANWYIRRGFHFTDCELEGGVIASSGSTFYAAEFSPPGANVSWGSRYDDVTFINCTIKAALNFTAVKNATVAGGSLAGSNGYLGNAWYCERLTVAALNTNGLLFYNDTSTVKYGVTVADPDRPGFRVDNPWRAGFAYGPSGSSGTRQFSSDGACTYLLLYVPNKIAVTGIGIDVTTAGTSPQVVRLGLYKADAANGFPGTLVQDGGIVDPTTTGVKWATIAQTLEPGWYWVAVAGQGGATGTRPTMRSSTDLIQMQPISSAATTWGAQAVSASGITGSMTANPTIGGTSTGNPIFARLRT
jgi:hypothetical protein